METCHTGNIQFSGCTKTLPAEKGWQINMNNLDLSLFDNGNNATGESNRKMSFSGDENTGKPYHLNIFYYGRVRNPGSEKKYLVAPFGFEAATAYWLP